MQVCLRGKLHIMPILENLAEKFHDMLTIKFLWGNNTPEGNHIELYVCIPITPGKQLHLSQNHETEKYVNEPCGTRDQE
jgi:hypothetical protein